MHVERAEVFELFDYPGSGAVDGEWAVAGGDCVDVILPGQHAGNAGERARAGEARGDFVVDRDGDGIVRSDVELSRAETVGAIVCGDAAGGRRRSSLREFAAGDSGSDAAGELRADSDGDRGGAGSARSRTQRKRAVGLLGRARGYGCNRSGRGQAGATSKRWA
jgi:hypothetical protein